MKEQHELARTRWHRLLGKLLEEVLSPVGVSVYTDVVIMTDPPEADILLLRRGRSRWSPEQLERLPDGVRESKAEHILLEFKYSESINEAAFRQALCYDTFYKRSKELDDHEVQTFLVSARTPRKTRLAKFGYSPAGKAGVYCSDNRLLRGIALLSLNELANVPHNAFMKCFASKKKEKQSAFNSLKSHDFSMFSGEFQWLVAGLWECWFAPGGDEMKGELTPERVSEMGRIWGEAYLKGLKPEERLKGLRPEERLKGLKPEERLKGLSLDEIETYLRKRRKSGDVLKK